VVKLAVQHIFGYLSHLGNNIKPCKLRRHAMSVTNTVHLVASEKEFSRYFCELFS